MKIVCAILLSPNLKNPLRDYKAYRMSTCKMKKSDKFSSSIRRNQLQVSLEFLSDFDFGSCRRPQEPFLRDSARTIRGARRPDGMRKISVLNLVAGLLKPSTGSVRTAGRPGVRID